MTASIPQKAGPTIKLSHILMGIALFAGYFWITKPAQPLLGWGDNFQEAQRKAQDNHRPMLLAFYMEGCGPCVAMDRKVLPQKKVTEALQTFVPVRVDAMHETALANRYSVYATPTYAVLQPNGQMVAKCQGYQSPEEFVAFIDRATERMATTHPTADDQLNDPSTTAP